MVFQTQPYVVELDGSISIFEQGRMEPAAGLQVLQGDCRLVSDLQSAVAYVMTIEADNRYVELMVSRKLQEKGDFDEPVSIITHWKRKRSRTATEIFFTALPTRIYHQYLDYLQGHEDHVLLFPLYEVMYRVLEKLRPSLPIAVVFQHNRFVDIIIGSSRRVYSARQLATYDTSPKQISALWDMVHTEIASVTEAHHIHLDRVYALTWIDSGPLPQWSAEHAVRLHPIGIEASNSSQSASQASFLKVLSGLKTNRALNPLNLKGFYWASRLMPHVALCLLAALLLSWGAWFGWLRQTEDLHHQLSMLYRQCEQVQTELAVAPQPVAYQPVIEFVQDMAANRSLPSLKNVMNTLSTALSGQARIETLKLTYESDRIHAEVFGHIKAPFEKAYDDFRALEVHLEKYGYSIADERLDTDITQSQFLISFSKRAQ